jgi:hypothetical protein
MQKTMMNLTDPLVNGKVLGVGYYDVDTGKFRTEDGGRVEGVKKGDKILFIDANAKDDPVALKEEEIAPDRLVAMVLRHGAGETDNTPA